MLCYLYPFLRLPYVAQCDFYLSLSELIGVRDMPERDIESLGAMGWGLEAARKFFRRRRRRRRRRRPRKWVFEN